MRLQILLVLFTGLLLAADAPKADATKKDMELFQGTWTVYVVERDGMPVPEDEIKALRLTVQGNKRTLKVGDEVRAQSTFKLDASKSPKWIDVTLESGDMKGQTFHGIYEIDADTQKTCITLKGDERPKDFTSKEGSGHLLQIFKRIKK